MVQHGTCNRDKNVDQKWMGNIELQYNVQLLHFIAFVAVKIK